MIARLVTLIAVAHLLSACDPRLTPTSNLSPREVQTLAGIWQGRSPLTYGGKACTTGYVWTLRVAGGNVEGEVVDEATPRATPSKFTTFLDYDGSMHAQVRPGGDDTTVRGAFNRDSFSGDAKGKDCSYILRLRRTASS